MSLITLTILSLLMLTTVVPVTDSCMSWNRFKQQISTLLSTNTEIPVAVTTEPNTEIADVPCVIPLHHPPPPAIVTELPPQSMDDVITMKPPGIVIEKQPPVEIVTEQEPIVENATETNLEPETEPSDDNATKTTLEPSSLVTEDPPSSSTESDIAEFETNQPESDEKAEDETEKPELDESDVLEVDTKPPESDEQVEDQTEQPKPEPDESASNKSLELPEDEKEEPSDDNLTGTTEKQPAEAVEHTTEPEEEELSDEEIELQRAVEDALVEPHFKRCWVWFEAGYCTRNGGCFETVKKDDDGYSYSYCVCKGNWTGINCDEKKKDTELMQGPGTDVSCDDSFRKPYCLNEGRCFIQKLMEGVGKLYCDCKDDYTGERCEEKKEDPNNALVVITQEPETDEPCWKRNIKEGWCHNGGECFLEKLSGGGVFKYCVCKNNWTGDRCMKKVEETTEPAKTAKDHELPSESSTTSKPKEHPNGPAIIIQGPGVQQALNESTDEPCEVDFEKMFCLNDGKCFIEQLMGGGKKAYCVCTDNWSGERCMQKEPDLSDEKQIPMENNHLDGSDLKEDDDDKPKTTKLYPVMPPVRDIRKETININGVPCPDDEKYKYFCGGVGRCFMILFSEIDFVIGCECDDPYYGMRCEEKRLDGYYGSGLVAYNRNKRSVNVEKMRKNENRRFHSVAAA